jgi:hypothetical protein
MCVCARTGHRGRIKSRAFSVSIWKNVFCPSINCKCKSQTKTVSTSFPGPSLFRRKDPGNSWLCGCQKTDCLRGCGESIILHASTSPLFTSIARSECLICKINFENHIHVKMLAKSDFCLLLNYKKIC